MFISEIEKNILILPDGREIKYRLDFRTYLNTAEILTDEDLTEQDKIKGASRIITSQSYEINTAALIVEAFLKKYEGKGKGENVLDFIQDGEVLFAAFWQSYKINLHSCDLTISEFLALARNLPKNTRMAEIIEIRQMKLPKPNGHNSEQISQVQQAKQKVKLTGRSSKKEDMNNLAKALKGISE